MKVAKSIEWMPEFGLDRELDWLKNMHDWLISKKNRYWGLALPIYECKKCQHFTVVESEDELKKLAVEGWSKYEGHTPHKPYIDKVKIKCPKCGETVSRIDDVGNPWLDAGIVAYSTIKEGNVGEPLYLKDRNEWEKWFPANFITESFPGQFKNWFYALIAMSTVMEDRPPFERVLGFGTLLGEDGRPMHKSWGNSIEFNEGADKIGVDVMRWMFVRQNPADNMLFGYKKATEVKRLFYLMLWNVYKFYVDYVNLDKYEIGKEKINPVNVLDKWLLSRFTSLTINVENSLRNYEPKTAATGIEQFVSDFSTWYIRRSRDRVWVNSQNKQDTESFYRAANYVLVNLAIIISPFMPFISEEIFTNLTGEASVHLSSWPKVNKEYLDPRLEKDMAKVRAICESGHAKRKADGKKVRIPLAKIEVELDGDFNNISPDVFALVLAELNVKNVVVNKKIRYPKKEVKVSEDDLEKEGELRELVRLIQSKRKEMGLTPTQKINLVIPDAFMEDVEFIKRRVVANRIEFGNEVAVTV